MKVKCNPQFDLKQGTGIYTAVSNYFNLQELDLAIGPLTITSVRQSVIDFTVPYMEDGGAILTKGDKPPDLLYQFRPFSPGVWLLLCAYIVMTGAVLFTICKVNSACGVSGGQHTAWSLQDCILLTFSSFVSQGANIFSTTHPYSFYLSTFRNCFF